MVAFQLLLLVVCVCGTQSVGPYIVFNCATMEALASPMKVEGDLTASVSEDDMRTLKLSRSSYLGHLTRLYQQIETLMLVRQNASQVTRLSEKLKDAHTKFTVANLKYRSALRPEDLKEKHEAELLEEAQEAGKSEFFERLHEWLTGSQHGVKDACSVKSCVSSKGSSHGSSKTSSRSSRSSSKLIEAKTKEAVAQLRLRQLTDQQRIKRDLQELKLQEEFLEANNEVQVANLERSMWEEEVNKETGQATLLPQQFQKELRSESRLNPTAHVYFPPKIDAPHMTQLTDMQSLLNQQKDAYATMAAAIREGFSIPKPELLKFHGETTEYWRFISNFETNIHQSVFDNSTRLSLLIQHCYGDARSSIEDCVILDPAIGYSKARDILHRRYGCPHLLARAHVTQLTNGPPLKASDHIGLQRLSVDMNRCLLTLTQMNYSADLNNSENLLRIARRLPMHLRSRWAEKADTILEAGSEPSFSDMAKFIEYRLRVCMNMYSQDMNLSLQGITRPAQVKTKYFNDIPQKVTTMVTQNNGREEQAEEGDLNRQGSDSYFKCPCCPGSHYLSTCAMFKTRTFDERRTLLREKGLCDNCFRYGHLARGCMRKGFCTKCSRKHHTLLHPPFMSQSPATDESSSTNVIHEPKGEYHNEPREANKESDEHVQCAATGVTSRQVRMRIVPIKVHGSDRSKVIETYALLDDCSDVTLCSKDLLQQLGIVGVEKTFSLTTVNKDRAQIKGSEVALTVRCMDDTESVNLEKVWSIDTLPISERSIPKNEDTVKWPHLQGLRFPRIEGQKVTILIGSDVPEVFWSLEERRGKRKEPFAVRTLLGWTLLGPMGPADETEFGFINFINQGDENLHQQVEQFWKTDFGDRLMDPQTAMSVEDKRALSQMEHSVVKVTGHYQLDLPWRNVAPYLPNNKPVAESRLHMLKRRFQKDKDLFDKYKCTINDYVERGYAEKVLEGDEIKHNDSGPIWYLPHHPVTNPHKPEKVRVVFDCAAKYKGVSLNDQLLHGPNLTNNLAGVLIRFRQEEVAIVADIEAMFHQVKVTPKDRGVLRFLWWPNDNVTASPVEYQMCVHIFGATSSPSCSSFALRRVAQENEDKFSNDAINTVYRNFYVDDCLKSLKTECEAIALTHELSALLAMGGFHLTKWISNSRNVLASIPDSERAKTVVNLDLDDLPVERALGIQWDVETDKFKFGIVNKEKPATRRGMLSVVSSVYDPIGFIAPVILSAKRMLQGLCKERLGWDEELKDNKLALWEEWLHDLNKLTQVDIDRCLKPQKYEESVVQLHHFADASQVGYSAVSYLRFSDKHGHVHCSFVIGKARLAPLKPITIPRLELTAAVMAVRLDQMLKVELDLTVHETIFWTDSMAVLQYIENKSSRFQIFVANRLAVIHDTSEPSQWRYVNTTSNPADYGSRGLKASQTREIQGWLMGPEFLWKDECFWPVRPNIPPELLSDVELKKEVTTNLTVQSEGLDNLFSRYSSWYRLQRAIAWLLRYKDYCCKKYLKKTLTLETGNLKLTNLFNARNEIVRCVQSQHFSKEMSAFENNKEVRSTNSLNRLSPMLVDGVIRVGGRLQRAPVSYDVKHPMILPYKDHVTDLIIHYYHKLSGHSGPEYVLAAVRREFWVVKGRAATRRVLGKCFECRKRSAPIGEQFMAPLPEERLTPDKPPFTYVGVDYFGPLYVKQGRSIVKRYGCLFTCMTSRAVHIEIAHSLSTDAFINTLRRFISRRGAPEKIFSDNGTNFRGGEKELRDSIKDWNQSKINGTLQQRGVDWNFNPPAASHMGGVWERMIRSVRRILKMILKEQLVTDETLLTLMTEVEMVINDRPLTSVSDNPVDLEPLTPSSLLLLRASTSLPPGIFDVKDMYCRRRWRQAQYLANIFWRRWIREYIPALQIRQKWMNIKRNLSVGDLVILVEDNIPRGKWLLGRVVSTHPDCDGHVRSVEVKTATATYVRPITKLCLLEADVDQKAPPHADGQSPTLPATVCRPSSPAVVCKVSPPAIVCKPSPPAAVCRPSPPAAVCRSSSPATVCRPLSPSVVCRPSSPAVVCKHLPPAADQRPLTNGANYRHSAPSQVCTSREQEHSTRRKVQLPIKFKDYVLTNRIAGPE